MLDSYTTTQLIAAFFGLYMVAAGIGLVADRNFYQSIIDSLRDSAALGFVTGLMVFVMGAVIVSIHNAWSTPLEIIVSLLGWGALVEGILMLAFRRPFIGLVAAVPLSPSVIKGFSAIAIIAGAVLMYCSLA